MPRFDDWKEPEFDELGMTKWGWLCQHHDNLKLAKHVDIGAFTYINAKEGVEMEELVQIGSHCSIYTISTIDGRSGPVVLRRNCRIGTHSTIMPGVTVGESAMVGAHSYVNADIPPRSLAYGVPARVIRELTPEEIGKMEEDAR